MMARRCAPGTDPRFITHAPQTPKPRALPSRVDQYITAFLFGSEIRTGQQDTIIMDIVRRPGIPATPEHTVPAAAATIPTQIASRGSEAQET